MSNPIFYVGNVLTGQIQGDLPFEGATVTWALSGTGTFQGKLRLGDQDVRDMGAPGLIVEGQTTIYVEYNGVLLWAGIVWATAYDSDTSELTVNASDFWSYLGKRLVTDNLTYASVATETLVDTIMGYAMPLRAPGGLSTVHWIPQGQTDPMIPYSYAGKDRKTVAELLEGIASGTPGIDFRVDVAWSGNTPSVIYHFGHPRLGQQLASTGGYFDYPGNVRKYTEGRDGTKLTTRLFVTGNADGTSGQETIYEDLTLYTTYPRYDSTASVDESNSGPLANRGQYVFNTLKAVVPVPAVEVTPDGTVPLGSYYVGDFIRLRIDDYKYANQEWTYRLAAISWDVDNYKVTLTPWLDPNG